MIKEYIGSLDNRHNLTKYTLSNGVEAILNEQEEQELFEDSELYRDIKQDMLDIKLNSIDLEDIIKKQKSEIEVLATKLEKYKETIKSFKEFQEQISKLKV